MTEKLRKIGDKITAVETGDALRESMRNIAAARTLDMIQGFATTNAIATLADSKLLDDLLRDGVLHAPSAAERHGYDPHQTTGLLRFLATQDLLKEEPEQRFYPTPIGNAILTKGALGIFELYRDGYGELMQRAGGLLDRSLSYGKDIARNPKHVSQGSSRITNATLDEVPLTVLEAKGARTIADLGCGMGDFAIAFARRSPQNRVVGIDIAAEAVEGARAAANAANVGDRVKMIKGDAFDLRAVREELRSIDAFYSFAVEHEILRGGEEAWLNRMDTMAELFPGKSYLMGEPMLHMADKDGAFYWVHILSQQGIPRNVPKWQELFARMKRARLEEVFVPDHQKFGAYFWLRFPGE